MRSSPERTTALAAIIGPFALLAVPNLFILVALTFGLAE